MITTTMRRCATLMVFASLLAAWPGWSISQSKTVKQDTGQTKRDGEPPDSPWRGEGEVRIGPLLIVPFKLAISAMRKDGTLPPLQYGGVYGVMVMQVLPGTPAADAGLQQFDIIYELDGKRVSDFKTYAEVVKSLKPGQSYKMSIRRMPLIERMILTASIEDKQAYQKRLGPRPDYGPMKGRPGTKKPTWELLVLTVTPQIEAVVRKAMREACPLELIGAILKDNATGTPQLSIGVKNVSLQDVVALEVKIEGWNRFGDPVKEFGFGPNNFVGISQTTIKAGGKDLLAWALYGQDIAARAKITLMRVKLDDGTEWRPKGDKEVSVMAESEK